MPYTSRTVRIVPILTTPADTVHTRQTQIDRTRDPLEPMNAMSSSAARAGDVQNAKDRCLAPSTAKIVRAGSCDLCARRHEKVCSVARAEQSRARCERLVGRRALAPVAHEDGNADVRKQRVRILT